MLYNMVANTNLIKKKLETIGPNQRICNKIKNIQKSQKKYLNTDANIFFFF